jgi:hypothetical protein
VRPLLASTAGRLLGAATLALGFACCAASASADSIRQVTRGPDASDPQTAHVPWAVQATLSGNTVTITNPQPNDHLPHQYARNPRLRQRQL